MPVLKIFYDESLDSRVRAKRHDIQGDLNRMMRDVLAADPAKCQVIMIPTMHCTPKPVYVDLQFRANPHRTQDVVERAMQDISGVLLHYLKVGLRIRGFDIDQATLHALDVDAEGAS